MALDNEGIKLLIQQLELDRQAYLNSHNRLQQALLSILPDQAENTPSTIDAVVAQPEPSPSHHRSISISSRRTVPTSLFGGQSKQVTSLYSAESSDDSDEDESFFAQRPLDEQEFDEDDLKRHIKSHPWNDHGRLILGSLRKHARHPKHSLFRQQLDSKESNHNHADIYEVDEHGAPIRNKTSESEDGDKPTWEALRQVNKAADRKQAVGRIIVMREPSPLLFTALHLVLNDHFDMDFIYRVLIDDETSTKAFVKGHLFPDERHQRSLVFVFKYHTLVGKDRKPLPWQNHEEDIESKPDHIPISTCSSVVALSLSGKPIRSVRRHSRKSKSPETSHIFDPFGPYHVLSLQCFPDWESEVNLHETHHHYVNGCDAFLATLLHEYRDALKRFKALSRRITELVTPEKRVIFVSKMRDELLFENKNFVYSRRYFWASQTFGLIIDELEAMISSYKDTFTDEVWSGEHKTLFPGPASTSARYTNWRKKMGGSRKLLEREIENLKDLLRTCIREQKEIEKLREWLFAGTSVQESRKAVEQAEITVNQGYNIKLLTLTSIFFLPLTFVTSIFGMTNMNPNESFAHFGIVTAAICLPTYFLIAIINQPDQFERTVAFLGYPFVLLSTGFKHSSSRARKYRLKHMNFKRKDDEEGRMRTGLGRERANTTASLDVRLSHSRDRLYSDTGVPVGKEEIITLPGKDGFGDEGNENGTVRPVLPERESTIRFEVPEYRRSTTAPALVQGHYDPSPGTSAVKLEFDEKGVNETPRTDLNHASQQIGQGLQEQEQAQAQAHDRLAVPQRIERNRKDGSVEASYSAPTRALLRRFTSSSATREKSPV